VTLISPFAASREQARRIVGKSFVEVYVKASVETCKSRDPKNLYKKALEGNIPNFTGLTSPYEIPENPDLVLDTEKWSEVECVEALTSAILTKLEDNDL
jgi:adenylylsulfate kinase-like enzyme